MQGVALNSISYIISIITTLGLGFWIFAQSSKKKINRFFFIFTIGIIGWLISLFIFYNTYIPDWQLFIGRFNFAITTLLIFFAFEFVLVFPDENFVVKKWLHYLITAEVTLLFFITLFTPLIDQNETVLGYSRMTSYGQLYYLHVANFVFFMFLVAWVLIKKIVLSLKEDKIRIYYVIFGLLLSAIFGFITNIIIPLLGYQNSANLGAFSVLFLLFAFSYAIIKHHLFDVKVIVAELLVFSLCVILVINTSSSFGSPDFLFNVVILVFVVITGIFLIKGVIKEVEQREKIEKIEKEVEKAYVVEKQAHAMEKQAKEETEKAYEIEKKANEELKTLDKVKNQFLMQAQHDLRSPLGTFKAYSDTLASGLFGKLPPKALTAVKMMYNLAESKLKEVNAFLDVSQFQLGKGILSLKPDVDVLPILEEVINELTSQAESKKLYLKLQNPEKVSVIRADREKLKAAIYNIVDNCIKYTIKGGVTVKLENNGPVKVIISDTGIGIAPEKVKTLFNAQFERSEQAQKMSTIGKGIGLYLSGQIIRAHNGRAWAESEGVGKGSVFHVELPI